MESKLKKTQHSSCKLLAGASLLCLSAPSLAGWEVQWIDKFNGTGVNWDNWTAQTQANYNNEVQCYTDDDNSPEKNYDVSDGTLKIIARKKDISCPGLAGTQKSWTSGRLNGKDKSEFLYGRIESRIRFDKLEGGSWPAFWMLENRIQEQPYKNDNDFSHWPNSGAGEIDIWEWFSNEPDTYITNFFNEQKYLNNSCGKEVRYSYPNGGADVQNWHNYALQWSKDNISFYIDETLVVSQDVSNCSQYKEPMFVLLNVAMGGMLGGNIDPSLQKATMEVDYVAHCIATDENDTSYCNESTPSAFDKDADGVADSVDACPNTTADTQVAGNGCAAEEAASDIPKVAISMMQNGQNITEINPQNGIVTLSAFATNINSDPGFYIDWNTDSLPSPTAGELTITFDPASMTDGNYLVSAVLTDYSDATLTASDQLSFTVKSTANQVDASQGNSKSGGSMSCALLLCLGLISLFRRQRRC